MGLTQGQVNVVDDHDSCLGLEKRLNIQEQRINIQEQREHFLDC